MIELSAEFYKFGIIFLFSIQIDTPTNLHQELIVRQPL